MRHLALVPQSTLMKPADVMMVVMMFMVFVVKKKNRTSEHNSKELAGST